MVSKESAKLFEGKLVLIRVKDRDNVIVGKLLKFIENDIVLEHPKHGISVFSLDHITEIQPIKQIGGDDHD